MVEYRLMIERPIHEPHEFLRTEYSWWAQKELKRQRERYETWEPRTKIFMEKREVEPWERVDD